MRRAVRDPGLPVPGAGLRARRLLPVADDDRAGGGPRARRLTRAPGAQILPPSDPSTWGKWMRIRGHRSSPRFIALAVCAAALALSAPAAHAADITGTWDMASPDIADQTWTFTTGTGTLAGYGAGGPYTWPMEGTISGNAVQVKTTYNELPSYTAYLVGTVSADGTTMSGTWSHDRVRRTRRRPRSCGPARGAAPRPASRSRALRSPPASRSSATAARSRLALHLHRHRRRHDRSADRHREVGRRQGRLPVRRHLLAHPDAALAERLVLHRHLESGPGRIPRRASRRP